MQYSKLNFMYTSLILCKYKYGNVIKNTESYKNELTSNKDQIIYHNESKEQFESKYYNNYSKKKITKYYTYYNKKVKIICT